MRSRISSVDREPVEVLEGDVFLAGGGVGGAEFRIHWSSMRSRCSRCGCSSPAWAEVGRMERERDGWRRGMFFK